MDLQGGLGQEKLVTVLTLDLATLVRRGVVFKGSGRFEYPFAQLTWISFVFTRSLLCRFWSFYGI